MVRVDLQSCFKLVDGLFQFAVQTVCETQNPVGLCILRIQFYGAKRSLSGQRDRRRARVGKSVPGVHGVGQRKRTVGR